MITRLPERHLFGRPLSTGTVPVTNLQLQITGIVLNEKNSKLSKAYISSAGQLSKIYRIGDTLPSGVKLYEITADTVIFENDGRLEKLSLTRLGLHFTPKPEGTLLHAQTHL